LGHCEVGPVGGIFFYSILCGVSEVHMLVSLLTILRCCVCYSAFNNVLVYQKKILIMYCTSRWSHVASITLGISFYTRQVCELLQTGFNI